MKQIIGFIVFTALGACMAFWVLESLAFAQ
jgi:hypothetical protein